MKKSIPPTNHFTRTDHPTESKQTLLLIDDCLIITRTMARFFSQKLYNVLTSNQPIEAEQIILKHTQPLIIISAIRMPGLNGLKLAESTFPHREQHHQPFLINSGSNDCEMNKLSQLKLYGIIHSFHNKGEFTIQHTIDTISKQIKQSIPTNSI